MDLKIIKKQNNVLLSRVEIEAEADFINEATPKKEDIKNKIVSMEKADAKLIVVKNIYGRFGSGKATVSVYIYSSEDELKKVEPKKKEKKAKPGESAEAPKEKKKEEAPKAEAPKEKAKEAPKEDKKE